jgi:hypothetical protein
MVLKGGIANVVGRDMGGQIEVMMNKEIVG